MSTLAELAAKGAARFKESCDHEAARQEELARHVDPAARSDALSRRREERWLKFRSSLTAIWPLELVERVPREQPLLSTDHHVEIRIRGFLGIEDDRSELQAFVCRNNDGSVQHVEKYVAVNRQGEGLYTHVLESAVGWIFGTFTGPLPDALKS
jgi:hypothetical protein